MSRQTFDDLQRFKTRRALPTWDSTVTALLAESADAGTGTARAQAPARTRAWTTTRARAA